MRIKDWQSSPCIADERSRAALERIRHQQLLAREKLLALDRRRRDLDVLIEQTKHLTVQHEADVSDASNNNYNNKYPALIYIFQPIAAESLGPVNCSAVSFLSCLGRRIAEVSGET